MPRAVISPAVRRIRLRRLLRGPLPLAVDVRAALNLIGFLTKYLSLAFLFPLAIAVGYGESLWPFLTADEPRR